MTTPAPLSIVHRPEASRFEALLDGGLGLCVYRRDGPLLLLTHTEVRYSVPETQQSRHVRDAVQEQREAAAADQAAA